MSKLINKIKLWLASEVNEDITVLKLIKVILFLIECIIIAIGFFIGCYKLNPMIIVGTLVIGIVILFFIQNAD